MRVVQLGGQCVKADLPLVGAEVAHHAGQNHAALRIRQAFGHAVAHAGHQRMGGSQINADGDAPLVRIGCLSGF